MNSLDSSRADHNISNSDQFHTGLHHQYGSHPMPMPVGEMMNDPVWNHAGQDTASNAEMDMSSLGDFDVNAVSRHCSTSSAQLTI